MNFLPATHTYIDDAGKVMPSVTQVIRHVYGGWEADDVDLQRGSAVHSACAMVLRGKSFEWPDDNSKAECEGKVEACRRFLREVPFKPYAVEMQCYDCKHHFAGTPDAWGSLLKWPRLLLDWKSSPSKTDLLQLAGYSVITGVNYGVIVEIRADGTYSMGKIEHLGIWKTRFLNTLSVYNVCRELGIQGRNAKNER